MPQPKKYKAQVVSILNPVDNIYSVEIRSLSGKFRYNPGQFLHIALDEYNPSFDWPESRCFSIQSSPANELLKITFSVKGKFTGRMALELFPGKIVDLKLPYGELFQRNHPKQNVVFIAGGTGITPFISAFNESSFEEYTSPKLYFGVRQEAYNIYQKEIEAAQRTNKSFIVKILYQDVDGMLNINSIFKDNSHDSTYFISGPQSMISDFKSCLKVLGVNDNNIRTDEWE
jgi:ferredoxin-NADP reductase